MIKRVMVPSRPLSPEDNADDKSKPGKHQPKPGSTAEIKKREARSGTGNVNAADDLEHVMNDTDPTPNPTPVETPPEPPEETEREHPGISRGGPPGAQP